MTPADQHGGQLARAAHIYKWPYHMGGQPTRAAKFQGGLTIRIHNQPTKAATLTGNEPYSD